MRVPASLEEAENACRSQVDDHRELLVLAGGIETQSGFAGSEAHVRRDRRCARGGATGANEDAAARRVARRRCRRRHRRSAGGVCRGAGRAAVAQGEARIEGRRQDGVSVVDVAVADAQPVEGRPCGRVLARVAVLVLAELPRGAAVGKPLEVAVELARLEFANAQRAAAPGAPEIEVAELEARVTGEQHVRGGAPRRRADLDRIGSDPDAADQTDPDSRRFARGAAEDDATIERAGKLALHRADQERPADRLADRDRGDQRDKEADQHERSTDAGTPRG